MPEPGTQDLPAVAREIEEFVALAGWNQRPQLFALVVTAELLQRQPELAGQVEPADPLTPIAQDELPDGDLGEALAGIMWPEGVTGCALSQEIVVLPPEAEASLPAGELGPDQQAELLRMAAEHPDRQDARLVAAVLRDGTKACVLRLRSTDSDQEDDLVVDPELAPNLTGALLQTLH